MDTLCIPIAKNHYDLRLLCINRMEGIYATANAVLVLDGTLQSTQFGGSEPNEALAQISYCPWT